MDDLSRREFGGFVGGTSLGALAGCLDGSDGSSSEDTQPDSGSESGPPADSGSQDGSDSRDFDIPQDELTSDYHDTHRRLSGDLDQFHADWFGGSGNKGSTAVTADVDYDNGKVKGALNIFGPENIWREDQTPTERYLFFKPDGGDIFIESEFFEGGDRQGVDYMILDPDLSYEGDEKVLAQVADESNLRELFFSTELSPFAEDLTEAIDQQPLPYDNSIKHEDSGDEIATYRWKDASQSPHPVDGVEDISDFFSNAAISKENGTILLNSTNYDSPENDFFYRGRFYSQDRSLEEPDFARRAKASE